VLTSNDKGNIAEIAIALEAMKLGVEVLKPVAEHGRYDLAFDLGDRILRVQCKTAKRRGEVLVINLVSSWHSPGGYVRNKYEPGEVDLIAAHDHESGACYLLPFDLVSGMTAFQLRLSPPKNGQRASIHFAAEHTLPGAIAQLGERVRGTHEVAGSSPAGSTPQADGDGTEITVGAHQFRNHFGYWMERAAAGDEVLITRRGRRYARLSLPDQQLATTDTAPAPEPAADPEESPSGTARTSR
jgi:antitoxin (DNA-binding transcriptional repressor) of toxin-antitoxin stability system